MLWPMYCGSPLFGTSGGIEQEDVSMNEYLKQYIELQKQFRETKGKADRVRALYALSLIHIFDAVQERLDGWQRTGL